MPAHIRRFAAPAFVLALVLLAGAPAAFAAFPGTNGKIVFDRGSEPELDTINPDGSGRTRLTSQPGYQPSWSPDGAKVAFYAGGAGGFADIFVVNADGTGLTNVTNTNNASEADPAWSPDGSRILFTDDSLTTGELHISVMNADGGGRQQLTTSPNFNVLAVWSPAGGRIAYTTNTNYPEGDFDIATMNTDGTGKTVIASGPEDDIGPDWSPDGTRIVFSRDLEPLSGEGDIWVMNANGSGQTQLTSTPGADTYPAFSPNGAKIVFQGAGFPGDLYTMNADGTGRVNLTNSPNVSDFYADWQTANGFSGPYVRPKGATPFKVSLVPAYNQCTVPNRQHGPPLAFPACTPPTFASNYVTVGTMDANGAESNSEGSFRLKVVIGAPGPPEDSNVLVQASITDVRCAGSTSTCGNVNAADGRDYVGQLAGESTVRVIDRWNAVAAGGGNEGATAVDFPFPFPFTCTNTADVDVGGTCTSNTSVNAIVPLAVRDRKRTVWQLGALQVNDGGPDGVTNSIPNTKFMTQGLFVP